MCVSNKIQKSLIELNIKNSVVIYNGIKFDSKKEMQRYKDLELLESTNYICNLELQKKFFQMQ